MESAIQWSVGIFVAIVFLVLAWSPWALTMIPTIGRRSPLYGTSNNTGVVISEFLEIPFLNFANTAFIRVVTSTMSAVLRFAASVFYDFASSPDLRLL